MTISDDAAEADFLYGRFDWGVRTQELVLRSYEQKCEIVIKSVGIPQGYKPELTVVGGRSPSNYIKTLYGGANAVCVSVYALSKKGEVVDADLLDDEAKQGYAKEIDKIRGQLPKSDSASGKEVQKRQKIFLSGEAASNLAVLDKGASYFLQQIFWESRSEYMPNPGRCELTPPNISRIDFSEVVGGDLCILKNDFKPELFKKQKKALVSVNGDKYRALSRDVYFAKDGIEASVLADQVEKEINLGPKPLVEKHYQGRGFGNSYLPLVQKLEYMRFGERGQNERYFMIPKYQTPTPAEVAAKIRESRKVADCYIEAGV